MTGADQTVFVVDDDPSVRRGLERLLRTAGYQVESFASAREFLLRCRREVIGCLVLDVRMPEVTGLKLREELTVLGIDIPVVFITGHGDVQMAVQAMKTGAVDFLTKPFDDVELLDAVAVALGHGRERGGSDSDGEPGNAADQS